MGYASSKQINASKCVICHRTPKQDVTRLPCQCMFICKTHFTDLICEKFNLKASIKCKMCNKVYELSRVGFSFVCAYCENILKEPCFLPCQCASICKEHIEAFLNSKESHPRRISCPRCGQIYDLKNLVNEKKLTPNLELGKCLEQKSFLNEHEIKLKQLYEHDLNGLDVTQMKLNEIINEFSLTQAEHFANLRNQIDIERETLIQEIYFIDKELPQIGIYLFFIPLLFPCRVVPYRFSK